MNKKKIILNIKSPIYPFLVSGGGCFILWLIAPIDFIFEGNMQAIILAIILPIIFSISLVIGFGKINTKPVIFEFDVQRLRNFVHLLFILGCVGLIIRMYERIFIRSGGVVSLNVATNRELIEVGGSGSLALIGGVLATFLTFIPFGLMLLYKSNERRFRYYLLIIPSLAYPVSDVIYQGSRSSFVMYIGIFIASLIVLKMFRIRSRLFFILMTLGLLLIWISAQVFASRSLQLGIDPLSSMTESGYAYFAPISSNMGEYISEEGLGGFSGLVYALAHFSQYFLHGIYEFFYLAANVSAPTTYGHLSFYIPLKIVNSLVSDTVIEDVIMNGVLRPGVYTTLFGPLMYDYGSIGSSFGCFILGYSSGRIGRFIKSGYLALLPIFLVIHGFLFFSFTVNLFTSGAGQYMLIASLLLSAFLSFRMFRLTNTTLNIQL